MDGMGWMDGMDGDVLHHRWHGQVRKKLRAQLEGDRAGLPVLMDEFHTLCAALPCPWVTILQIPLYLMIQVSDRNAPNKNFILSLLPWSLFYRFPSIS